MTPHLPLSRPCARRTFIKTALGSAVVSLLPCKLPAVAAPAAERSIPVGSNIYGWSQYYQRQGKNVNDHLDEVLAALRDAGYDYLEGFVDVKTPDNIAKLAEQMRAKGLRPVCLYSGGRFEQAAKAKETVEQLLAAAVVCQQAGFTLIDCNPDPIGRAKTDAELDVQAKALDDLGAGLGRLGMRLGIHNHTPEMADHAREFHHVFDHTNPKRVGLCYDVHWVFRGGIAPADCLSQYGDRVVSWHLRQSRDGIWWEDLDSGDIDYTAVAQFAKTHPIPAPLTVELALENGTKITRSAIENHRRSREFVRRTFGV